MREGPSSSGGQGRGALLSRRTALGLLLLLPAAAPGQEISLDDLIEAGRDWAAENLDPEALKALGEIDEAGAREFIERLTAGLQRDSVLDLAALRDGVAKLLPILEGRPETRPYAAWLRARTDYFDAAETLRQSAPTPPPPPKGQPPVRPPNPTPQQQKSLWKRIFSRRASPAPAADYVARLKPVFAAAKTPAELVWLAEVESSFNPAARSPAGAAGLFQLMPATAKGLGLSLFPRDQRLDPEKSAAAAARYLNRLHGRFGDWPLALAAYNAGEGNVGNLLKRHKAKTFEEISARLPSETQMYVPKVGAVVMQREGRELSGLPAPGA